MPDDNSNPASSIKQRLGLWDAVSIIVGIVIGTAIFRSPSAVFANSPGAGWAMGLWLLGGMLSWCGAVCYAELATTYPRDGGDYVYLTRAFGPWCGFLFAWAQLTTVLSGNIAIMAYAFADYGLRLWPDWKNHVVWLTIAPIIALSLLNAVGVVAGKVAQNVLTVGKVVGLGGLVLAGLWAGKVTPQAADATAHFIWGHRFGACVCAVCVWRLEPCRVRGGRSSRPAAQSAPALMLGLACITLIYLAVNAAYLAVLGFDGARNTRTLATDVMEHAMGAWGGRAISLLVMLSALGAINGMILTGTRIYAVWGADYPMIRGLGTWNRRTAAPTAAIAMQGAIAVLLILVVGTAAGRAGFDAMLHAIGLSGLPWQQYSGGFETLVAGSAPVYWSLCLTTGIAVFILRARDKSIERPFTIPLYPLPALLFCGTCAYMLRSSAAYAKWLSLLGVAPLVVGGIVWILARPARRVK